MARKKVITDDDVKALEEELEKKKSALADMREKLNMSRIDNFKAWCKHNGIDPMQFLKLAITEEFSADIKALYFKMTAEPVGVIKSSKPVQESVKIEKDKVVHSESEDDDNQTEVDSDDDEDDSLSDSDDDYDDDIDEDEDDSIDEDIDSENEEDDGQQKLWS